MRNSARKWWEKWWGFMRMVGQPSGICFQMGGRMVGEQRPACDQVFKMVGKWWGFRRSPLQSKSKARRNSLSQRALLLAGEYGFEP